MADAGEIAKMFVSIEARLGKLEAGLKQGEMATAVSGAKMGRNIAVGVEQGATAATASTTKATTKMGASVGGLRSALSRLLIPITAIASVLRVVDAIDKARHAAEEMRKEFNSIRTDFAKPIELQAYALRQGVDQFDVLRAELLDKAKETRAKIDELAKDRLINVGHVFKEMFGINALLGAPSSGDIRAEAERQQRMLTHTVEQGIKNIADQMAKELAKALKDFFEKQKDQSNKWLESIAIDSARSRQVSEAMQQSQPRGP